MGNTNSRTLHVNNKLNDFHSKSIPNIKSLSDETEQFYFAQALKLQEQFSFEKNLRLQHQFSQNNITNFNNDLFQGKGSNFHSNMINRYKSIPDYTYQEINQRFPINSQHIYHNTNDYNTLNSNKPQNTGVISHTSTENHHHNAKLLKKSSKKLNRFFKIGNTDNLNMTLNSSLSRSANRKTAMTKSMVLIDKDSNNNNHKTNIIMTAKKISEPDTGTISSYKNSQRVNVGTRLSCVDNFKAIDDNFPNNQFGSIELNKSIKSIDLNELNLLDKDSAKYKYLTAKNSAFNNSNNSSSSGCSSGASSSNLSSTRRTSQRPDSSLSTWSTNKMSTPSPPPPLLHKSVLNGSNEKPKPEILTSKQGNYTTTLNSAYSTKSILSETTSRLGKEDQILTKCSTPLENSSSHLRAYNSHLNGISSFSMKSKSTQNNNVDLKNSVSSTSSRGYLKKKAENSSLVKSDSVNSFNSILVMKPELGLNTFQSSLSSTGVSSSCGFVSSETSSISNSKNENTNNKLNYTSSVKLAKRGQNRFNKAKSESMYVRQPIERQDNSSPEVNSTNKILKKHKQKKQRDSGILNDLFNINGSVSNLRTKFTNATSSLRNSFSTFNLRSLSMRTRKSHNSKSKNRNKQHQSSSKLNFTENISSILVTKSNDLESDLDIDNEYENSDDNYNSPSEDEEEYNENYSEIYKTNPENVYSNKEPVDKTRSQINTFNMVKETRKLSSSMSNNILNRCNMSDSKLINQKNTNQNLESDYDTVHNPKSPSFISHNRGDSRKELTERILAASQFIIENKNDLKNYHNSILYKYNGPKTTSFTNIDQVETRRLSLVKIMRNSNQANLSKMSVKSESSSISDFNTESNNKNVSNHNEIIKNKNNLPHFSGTKTIDDKNSNNQLNAFKQVNTNNSVSLKNSNSFNPNKSNITFERPFIMTPSNKTIQGNDPIPVNHPPPQQQNQPITQHKKIVVQASTNDLLSCFAQFISQRCSHLTEETYINPLCYMNNNIGKRIKFEPKETIYWLRSADCALLVQGWQEIAFMNPVNVVFVYLLVRDTLKNSESVRTVYDLQCNIMACLYLAFSYMGNEISYPLKPFLIEENRSIFWQRTCDLMNKLSANMLRINRDPRYFTELFYELKSYALIKKSITSSALTKIVPYTKFETKNYHRKSSYIPDNQYKNNDSENKNDNKFHNSVKTDIIPSNVYKNNSQNNEKFQSRSSLNEPALVQANYNFNSSQNLNQLKDYSVPLNDNKKQGQFKINNNFNINPRSFLKIDKNRPNHDVIFSSTEEQPVAYCI